MLIHNAYSNQRELSLQETLTVKLAATTPFSWGEPIEVTKLRRKAAVARQVASEIPGAIIDSSIFEYLKQVKE